MKYNSAANIEAVINDLARSHSLNQFGIAVYNDKDWIHHPNNQEIGTISIIRSGFGFLFLGRREKHTNVNNQNDSNPLFSYHSSILLQNILNDAKRRTHVGGQIRVKFNEVKYIYPNDYVFMKIDGKFATKPNFINPLPLVKKFAQKILR